MALPPEPWLRGTITDLHPAAAHLLYTFEQAREELTAYCGELSVAELWQSPGPGVAAAGFHMRHMAGSIDRLTTYLRGEQLTSAQLDALRQEHSPGAHFTQLMDGLEAEFRRTEGIVRKSEPAAFADRREVGRRQLPTTVGGLIVHLSEHTQRHLGQAVLIAKLVTPPLPSLAD